MNIAAISTPAGIGGIAVIRVSGPDAIALTDKIFHPFKEENTLSSRKSHTLTYGQIVDPASGEVIDEVVASLYRCPNSFTGEDVVEISCHGSVYVQQRILQTLLDNGLRLAEPGEFTRRAFRNGKMDLSQAEAVADLIAANNAASHRLAINQLKGAFSRRLAELRHQLIDLSSLLELELDFSEEDVEFADRVRLMNLADDIHHSVDRLASSFQTGNAIRNGIPVTIIGETNAGKSTLLNQLLGDDKAIVSDIHGTTRDVIEDTIVMNGVLLRFIDTAGIRETKDTVEALGIERTYQRLNQANIVIWMIDGTRLSDEQLTLQLAEDAVKMHKKIAKYLRAEQKLIVLINKADLVSRAALANNIPTLQGTLNVELQCSGNAEDAPSFQYIIMSAKDPNGFDRLNEAIAKASVLPEVQQGDIIVTNVRHYEALKAADKAILRVRRGLEEQLSGDFIAQDLRECSHYLGTIVGEVSNDEILGSIFSRFCIGK